MKIKINYIKFKIIRKNILKFDNKKNNTNNDKKYIKYNSITIKKIEIKKWNEEEDKIKELENKILNKL